jgi:uncharacterized membrane protein YccC
VSVGAFFARELAPSRRRILEAARNATKATLTTGLAATMQILGPFGPLFAFRIGQPGISLGFFEGAVTIICAAAMQAAIVPITGKLLDSPGLILAFLFVVFALIAYLLSNTRLFLPLALAAVGTITTVYVGIFEPAQIGWGSTYTFDGILVATLVMVAIDTSIWPSSPEPRLLESIAADLARTRERFELVGRRYLDPFSAPLPTPLAKSRLTPNLVLLKSVEEHTKPTPQRLAALLNAVMTSERAYLEVERLAVLADQPVADEIRQSHEQEIEIALKILDTAFTETMNDILAGIPAAENSAQWVSDLGVTIRHLNELSARTPPATGETTGFETLNFLGFVGGLEAIANLLEPHEWSPGSTAVEGIEAEDDGEPHPFIDPARFRFSVKLGAAITLGLLVGLTTQRADLQTILWSIAVAGQPNQYGAVVRKTILRLAGCIVGGLATLAAMLIVSQNFDSLPPYLLAIFAVTMFSTYVAQSSEWLGYAGIQAGLTFLICYVGLAPASDIYRPLWRFWGIVLGVLTTGFVFLFLWPEYASDKVIESLAKLMRTTLALGREVAEKRITEERIPAVERRLSTNLFEALNLADQARLEGRRGSANSAAAIEAAATVIRIAYRFRIIARARLAGSEAALPHDAQEHCAALEQEYCAALESQLGKCESIGVPEEFAASSGAARQSAVDPARAIQELATGGISESTGRSVRVDSDLATQLESYRRLPILLASLDTALSKITASIAASPA